MNFHKHKKRSIFTKGEYIFESIDDFARRYVEEFVNHCEFVYGKDIMTDKYIPYAAIIKAIATDEEMAPGYNKSMNTEEMLRSVPRIIDMAKMNEKIYNKYHND